MKTTILKLLGGGSALAIILAFVGAANAQLMTGSLALSPDPFISNPAAYTASSLTLDPTNLVNAGAQLGSFAGGVVPNYSFLTATNLTITGLSSTPLADSITDYFVFSSPDATLGASGTTPNNRFEFNLATIREVYPAGSGAAFYGTGMLTDIQPGGYANTPAQFTLSFPDGGSTYSFTLAVVPEPSTIGLVVVGLLGALTIRRRKA